jgi:hypothetical protein
VDILHCQPITRWHEEQIYILIASRSMCGKSASQQITALSRS